MMKLNHPYTGFNDENFANLEDRVSALEEGGGGSTVSVTQVVTSGEKLATITVDDTPTDIYAPTDTGDTVTVTQVQSTGTKIATIGVNGTDTDLYAPDGGDYDYIIDFGTYSSMNRENTITANITPVQAKSYLDGGYKVGAKCKVSDCESIVPVYSNSANVWCDFRFATGTDYGDMYCVSHFSAPVSYSAWLKGRTPSVGTFVGSNDVAYIKNFEGYYGGHGNEKLSFNEAGNIVPVIFNVSRTASSSTFLSIPSNLSYVSGITIPSYAGSPITIAFDVPTTNDPSPNIYLCKGQRGNYNWKRLNVVFDGEPNDNIILKAPDDTLYRLKVANDGTLSTEAVV